MPGSGLENRPAPRFHDEAGEPCARVGFQRNDGTFKLDDLWFFTGSICNLRCLHCYTGSSPVNRTYDLLTDDDAAPFLAEARRYRVSHIYFTGGEPFLNPHILPLLDAALAVAPTTVLTNGTEPLERLMVGVRSLLDRHGARLSFRISLDHYDADRHNAIRRAGNGRWKDNFSATIENAARLGENGLHPIVTYTAEVFRGNPVGEAFVEHRTRQLFANRGVGVEVKFLPHVLEQGSQLDRVDRRAEAPVVTEAYLERTGVGRESLMCHRSRMVARRGGRIVIYPCPVLVGADPESADHLKPFELGRTLEESFHAAVPLAHPSCGPYCCRGRGTCANAR